MSAFEIYISILCFFVFSALTILFSALIAHIVRLRLRVIRGGLADVEISEYQEKHLSKRRKNEHGITAGKVFSLFFCLVIVAIFFSALFVRIDEKRQAGGNLFPSVRVVNTGSMASAHEKNKYLSANGLHDRLQVFDLIMIEPLPPESELKPYDIVLYVRENIPVIHRIVKIEEANDGTSDRLFLLQGDANEYPDKFPVRYSQMRGIYRGTRVPFIGSLVSFLHSPAGYLCIALIVFTITIIPWLEKKLEDEILQRMEFIGEHPEAAVDHERWRAIRRKEKER